MKKVILFAQMIDEANLKKVLLLLPYYLKKEYLCEATIYVARKSAGVPDVYRGIPIIVAPDFASTIKKDKIWCDLYISFGFGYLTPVFPSELKEINPHCVTCFVTDHAADMSESIKPSLDYRFWHFFHKLVTFPLALERFPKEKRLGKAMFQAFDYYFTETESAYADIKKHRWLHVDVSQKLQILNMGYDDESLIEVDRFLSQSCQRNNVFLFTGIVGGLFKKSEVLLKALPLVKEWKDWSVVLAGPVKPEFQKRFDLLVKKRPELKRRISLLGNVASRDSLFALYRNSKVFFLTSEKESSSYSLVEAALLGDYLISTPVGIAPELTQNGKFGSLVPVGSPKSLAQAFEKVILHGVPPETVSHSTEIARAKFSYENIVNDCSVFQDALTK